MSDDRDAIAKRNTAAVLTARGRGAVASIRWQGDPRAVERNPSGLFRAANGKPLADQPIGRVVFGSWGESPAEEVIVCRRDAYTVEVHCHGGEAAVRRILNDLEGVGFAAVPWTEQSAAESGMLEAECLEALSRATTVRTADILLDQYSGTLRRALEGLHATPPLSKGGYGGVALQGETSSVERGAIDRATHVEHRVALRAEACSVQRDPPCPPLLRGGGTATVEGLLRWASFGLHLTQAWRVVLTGRPNVGKSSLINALLGYARSIVFDQPGTTRDVVTADTALDGWPVQLADTAGIREVAGTIEAAGIDRARAHLAQADCRVVVLDASQPRTAEDSELLAEWPEAIVVANKSDLPEAWGDALPETALCVSSLTGTGLDALTRAIVARLVPTVPPFGTPIPVAARQVDLLREAHAAVAAGNPGAARRCIDEILR